MKNMGWHNFWMEMHFLDASLYPIESQIITRLSKENTKVKNKKLQKKIK